MRNIEKIVDSLPESRRELRQVKKHKKSTRKLLGILVVLAVSATLVGAALLSMYGGWNQPVEAKSSILVDGDATGEIQDLASFDVYGCDVIDVEHNIECVSLHPVNVSMTESITDSVGEIENDEIICEYWQADKEWSAPLANLTRTMDTVRPDDLIWYYTTTDGGEVYLMFMIANETSPLFMIVHSLGEWIYFERIGDGWDTGYTMTEGLEYQGVTVQIVVPGAEYKLTIQTTVLNDVFYWGLRANGGEANLLLVPDDRETDDDIVHVITDGKIIFPRILEAGELLDFIVRYKVHALIAPDTYNATVTFIPTP